MFIAGVDVAADVGDTAAVITTMWRVWPTGGFTSDCWCPSAAGSCRSPYDLQPASLSREPSPLGVVEEATAVLNGTILDHLRADRSGIAARQLHHLAALVDLV